VSLDLWLAESLFQPQQETPGKKKKSRGLLLCVFWLLPSPRYVAKLNSYCSGDTLVVQVPGAVVLTRITASASEQK